MAAVCALRLALRGGTRGMAHVPHYQPAGEFLYGTDPVVSCLRANRRRVHKLYVSDMDASALTPKQGAARRELQALIRTHRVPVRTVDSNMLRHMIGPGRPHNGVALDVEPLGVPSADALLAAWPATSLARSRPRVYVAMDHIEDPHNMGALLRSCLFFGVDGVVVPARHTSPLSPTVSKASAGALEVLPLYECPALPKFLQSLRRLHSMPTPSSASSQPPASSTRPMVSSSSPLRIVSLALDAHAINLTELTSVRVCVCVFVCRFMCVRVCVCVFVCVCVCVGV
jgi:tRNA G18 (ribose-2'-O)-methylase SpoU